MVTRLLMASGTSPKHRAIGQPEQMSTRGVFFIVGVCTAGWAALVPFAKARAGIDEATLGLLLLCLGVGSIVSMPLAGALAAQTGCRRVLIASGLLLCLTLPLLAVISSPPSLAATLFAFGAGIGASDVAMNIQAIIVERESGRSMMSGFHGLFSLGGIAGAVGMSALLGAGLSALAATSCLIAATAVALATAAPHLLPYGSRSEGPVFALPHGIVLFIGSLCFVVFLAEGAMVDWAAVFLTAVRGMNPAFGGLGYAAFSLTMTVGRLTGDRVVRRCGGGNVVIFGGLCAAAGFALATLVPVWQVALVGYALIGVGCSNIVPVLYTSVGRQAVVPEHVAVSAITTLGYAGILAGPAAIGFVAHLASLSAAFLIVAILLVGVAGSGLLLRVGLK
jgi:predicted MFS family arabinose efflux permease